MREPSWVHERPASASFRDLTVVTQKSASPALRTEETIIKQTSNKKKKWTQQRRFYELAKNVIFKGPTVPIYFI